MENNKYYQPEIEEFCVGFEYETIYLKSVWTKEVLYQMDCGWFFESYINDAVETEFRVKYLNREDIESLGFTQDKKHYEKGALGTNEFIKVKDENIFKIKTYWDYNFNKRENLIRIFKGRKYNYPYTEIFCGNIKNKNELQKLLKQLEICI